ncbi:conserved exported hypothetical protein [Nitrosopumilaceae archaeon]|nr:hypothetical protein [Nitrosopumilus sp.]CAI9831226.1 conserved exported hypothetical protein [Nitrosopumilaceae archaeon]MDA7944636.1 hypothetical protein [Nitrosopumilus sp.]MDA7954605.1 hypothetical protein [Nitrosopumilus sp.]MDA7973316.1 hypothetical protein [Nitrosopumilus sp.]
MNALLALGIAAALIAPAAAHAQSSDRITVIDNFGQYESGEPLFIYGSLASVTDGSFLIMQIINPLGDLCQIQQVTPLPGGQFITGQIPLAGRICGMTGDYEARLFYGDHTKSTAFSVSAERYAEPSDAEKLRTARDLVTSLANMTRDRTGISTEVPGPGATLEQLKDVYVNLWRTSFSEEYLYEVDPLVREPARASLDAVQALLADNTIPYDISQLIDMLVFEAVFLYEIGERGAAIGLISDAFVDVGNLVPEKKIQRNLTFDELEDTLLNLMKKSDSVMSREVKEEVAFIFARGTAPVYSDEITGLVDLLTEARYLDVVSRKSSNLYNIIRGNWDLLKPSLEGKSSIASLLEPAPKVAELHEAAILLRELDGVERFIDRDDDDLAEIIRPMWDRLLSSLASASQVGDILEAKDEIRRMKSITEISSRISKGVEISRANGISSSQVAEWDALLERVRGASDAAEVLAVVSEFDRSIRELREKRSPLVTLEFRYKELRQRAELQADYASLEDINNALRIIDSAKRAESGNPTSSRIDRMELLLTWAADREPDIRSKLESYTKDVSKVRASAILQRTQSLENLVELSIPKNRFLPNYIQFTDGLATSIANVRELVIAGDLDAADKVLVSLYDEWNQVSTAYAEDPKGSAVGYSLDELKRIDFRKRLDAFDSAVAAFRNPGFETYSAQYITMANDLKNMINRANFADAEKKVDEIARFLSQRLVLSDSSVYFEISFEQERGLWVMRGQVEKERPDYKDELEITIYNMDGSKHSTLEFFATKRGEFFTQWNAPAEPGLYVAQVRFIDPPRDATATQIVNIREKFEYKYTPSDQDTFSLARDFDQLKKFAVRFGGEKYSTTERLTTAISSAETAFSTGSTSSMESKLDDIKRIIDRYLPTKSREAIVEAVYGDGRLVISGAVIKDIAFAEDLYVDVFDQSGARVQEVALKDDSSGRFARSLPLAFNPGIYAVELQYLDLTVSDFFIVS